MDEPRLTDKVLRAMENVVDTWDPSMFPKDYSSTDKLFYSFVRRLRAYRTWAKKDKTRGKR